MATVACMFDSTHRAPVKERSITMTATVPGDLISDLYTANIIPDPIFEMVFRNDSYAHLWDQQLWVYQKIFVFTSPATPSSTQLVFDGVKMAANISLNGHSLGMATNQFVRYVYDVTALLRPNTTNTLVLAFDYKMDYLTKGRFMACSGGWDWAPVSNTGTQWPTFSRGIWKSVYLVSSPLSSAFLVDVVPAIVYTGPYPLATLTDDSAAPFNVTVKAVLQASAAVSGVLSLQGTWPNSDPVHTAVKLSVGVNELTVSTIARHVQLWWPAGMGAQPLYNFTVQFTPTAGPAVSMQRRVGFRVVAYVTTNDTATSRQPGAEGTGNFTIMFRVNGAATWVRGANLVPMEELEARADATALRRLVQSAAEANFNMIRINGVGIYQVGQVFCILVNVFDVFL